MDLFPYAAGEVVTSTANPAIKLARGLQARRKLRTAEQAFFAEGRRVVETLAERGTPLRVLFINHRQRDTIDPTTLGWLSGLARRTIFVDDTLFRSMVNTEQPQPMAAIFDIVELPVSPAPDFVLVLDSVRDPGNLGTITRSAAAAAVDSLVLLPGTVDLFNPRSVRASAGLLGAVPCRRVAAFSQVLDLTEPDARQVLLADASGETEYTEIDWRRPTTLALGGETVRISSELRSRVTSTVRIPMANGVESLNVAMAATILLFEAQRQRRQLSGPGLRS
jgi:TrmH family RNA methyltransferase